MVGSWPRRSIVRVRQSVPENFRGVLIPRHINARREEYRRRAAYPQIFVNYRRDDTEAYAGRLHDNLARVFSPEQVFVDQFSIEPGELWDWTIQQAAVHCAAMLVLIGPRWLAVDNSGRSRLQNERDSVHREIAAALDRNTTVIPVILQGGTIPVTEQLPYDMQGLERLQALKLTSGHWEADVQILVAALQRQLGA